MAPILRYPTFSALAIVCSGIVEAAPPREIPAESRVGAITVYADRARVTRTAQFDLPAGESVVVVKGLPPAIDDASLQVTAESAAKLTILSVEVRREFSAETAREEVRRLEEAALAIKDRQKEIEDGQAALNGRRAFLDDMRKGLAALIATPQGEDTPRPDLAAIRDAYAFHTMESEGIARGLRESEQAMRPLRDESARLERELARIASGQQRVTKAARVVVNAGAPGNTTLSLHYVIAGASWTPLYTARVDSETSRVALLSQAQIRQQTTEAWTEARLELSTSRPAAGARMPEIQPQWIDFLEYAEPLAAAAAPAPMMGRALMRDQAALASSDAAMPPPAAPAPRREARLASAEVLAAGFSAVFRVTQPATIPADGEPHTVTLGQQDLDAALVHTATPALAPTAFLKARVRNGSAAPLLGGEVRVFRDGDLLGTGQLKYVAAGAEYDLFLGADDAVKITYKKTVDRKGDAGLFGGKRSVVEREYEIKIENFRKKDADLELIDHLPVSKQQDIKVAGARFSENPAEQDEKTGKLTWKLKLKPGEERKILFGYRVEWPQDREISGL